MWLIPLSGVCVSCMYHTFGGGYRACIINVSHDYQCMYDTLLDTIDTKCDTYDIINDTIPLSRGCVLSEVCQLDVWNDVASKGQSHRYLVDNTSNASVPGLQLRRQVERNREVTYKSMVGPHRLQRGNLVYGDVIVPPLLLQGCGAHRHCRDILPKRLAT